MLVEGYDESAQRKKAKHVQPREPRIVAGSNIMNDLRREGQSLHEDKSHLKGEEEHSCDVDKDGEIYMVSSLQNMT